MQPFIAAMLRIRHAFYAAVVRSLLRTKHLLQTILKIWISPSVLKAKNVDEGGANIGGAKLGAEHFLEVIEKQFREPMGAKKLVALSKGLKAQMLESMSDNPLCMLPSFNHQLPSGQEHDTILALDVGGSTFRVALVELLGGKARGQEHRILTRATFKISEDIRQLRGLLFFDWMAEKIQETLSKEPTTCHDTSSFPVSMGMAWSFPIQ
jgi:hexokinase